MNRTALPHPRKPLAFRTALAALLLAFVAGCGSKEERRDAGTLPPLEDAGVPDAGPLDAGVPDAGPRPTNTAPTITHATQSAVQVTGGQQVTFRVTAQDAESPSLRFTWAARTGSTVGSTVDTGTTSEMVWTAPDCSASGLSGVTVTVTDEWYNSASRSFEVQLRRCAALAVAGGHRHSVAVFADNTVWTWGYNNLGQLGDGSTTLSPIPLQVPGLMGITAVAAGSYHSLALRKDGTVWAWGSGLAGQLGHRRYESSSAPVQVDGLTGVVAISARDNNSMALRDDGSVWVWGPNDSLQLGQDGPRTRAPIPSGSPRTSAGRHRHSPWAPGSPLAHG
ncbi:hypothetical protein ACLESO_21800 [Pyxidicoccus sp. 3LG]